MLSVGEFDQGVKHMAFSPTTRSQIFGVAQGAHVPVSFFQISEVQADSPVLKIQQVNDHVFDLSVDFHLTSGSGQLYWVTRNSIMHSQPFDTWPKEWKFFDHNYKKVNIASDYGSSSGLYMTQFDMESRSAFVGLLDSHVDVTSLAAYISLQLTDSPNEVLPTGAISLHKQDSTSDYDHLTVGFNYESMQGVTISDVFSLALTPTTGALLTPAQRLSLSYMRTLALNTLSDGASYAFVQGTASEQDFRLCQFDFTAQTASVKSANLPSPNWNLSSLTVKFLDQANPDIYLSALFNVDYDEYNEQGLVLTSVESRRKSALFASSWTDLASDDGQFSDAVADDNFATSLTVSEVQNNFTFESRKVPNADFYDDAQTFDYALVALSQVSVAAGLQQEKTLRINLPPDVGGDPAEIVTTFGMKIDSMLPLYIDYEGDEVVINVEDPDNYLLGLHA